MITVYTKPACQQCRMTTRHLDRAGADYAVVDLIEDAEAFHLVTETLGYQQAPVVTVTTPSGTLITHWSGYQPDRINHHTQEAS